MLRFKKMIFTTHASYLFMYMVKLDQSYLHSARTTSL